MEIDITHMVQHATIMPSLSGSVMELGSNAARLTWDNSLDYAIEHPLLKTEEEFEEARKYFSELGAWSKLELDQMHNNDIQALTVQFVAGDIREMESYSTYEEYQQASTDGQASGLIFRLDTEPRTWYFTLGM